MNELDTQNHVAQFYSKRYSGTGFMYHSRIVTQMLDGIKPKHKVLDVGCGPGFISQLYPNFDIEGIDISPVMIAKNPHNAQVGDAQKLPYKSNTFDRVVCRALLHHLPRPELALGEMYRVLKPGGKVAILETNSSILNRLPRKLMTYTSRFSKDHKNFEFKELYFMVGQFFHVTEVRFIGYLAYPLVGFPDFLNLRLPLGLARSLIHLDDWISCGPFKRLAFNVMLRGIK